MLGDRSLFPDLEPWAYFNHASIAPPSTAVRAAIDHAVDDYARRGASAWLDYRDQRDRLRAQLAALIGAAPDDIGLVASTSQGVVNIAHCLPWRRGERVIVFAGEFPTNVTPWQRAAAAHGLDLTMLNTADFERGVGLERLTGELASRPARLVAVSAVQFQTGFRMPLEGIAAACRASGTELFVDAIQAVGATPIDVSALGIDYLVAGSHKWMMGVEGCALLYISPARIEALEPRLAGWLSHEDGASFLFEGPGHLRYDRPIRQRADAFEIGAMNVLGCAALEAAVQPILALGVAEIHAWVGSILDRLETRLATLGFRSRRANDPDARSTILSLHPPEGVDLGQLWEAMANAGIACAMPDGLLRIAPHWPNDPSQADRCADAVSEIIACLRRGSPPAVDGPTKL